MGASNFRRVNGKFQDVRYHDASKHSRTKNQEANPVVEKQIQKIDCTWLQVQRPDDGPVGSNCPKPVI